MNKRRLLPLLSALLMTGSLASQPAKGQVATFDTTLPIIRSNLPSLNSTVYPQGVFRLTQPSIIERRYFMRPARPNIYAAPPLLYPSEGGPSLGYGTDMFIQTY